MENFIFYFFIFIFGLIIGSFLNAIIWRLHKEESIWKRFRSYCTKCEHSLNALDLIPLLSFGLLGGRCRYCRKKISWQYPLVELATGLLFVLTAIKYFGLEAQFGQILQHCSLLGIEGIKVFTIRCSLFAVLRDLVFISFLIIIFVYDLRYYLIIDKVTIPAMAIALIFNLALGILWWKLLLAVFIGGGLFFLQIIISKGKWVGGGDLRLGILMGLMLSWSGVLVALFIAYVTGAAVGLILVGSKIKTMKSRIPFGTFLSLAAVITLLYGEQILNWYLGLLR